MIYFISKILVPIKFKLELRYDKFHVSLKLELGTSIN